ncbi:MAG: hypothetical protein LBL66_08670 [Clostridiales bacterium]|nr:hypothetical protein [Clostridiales bacterium]
MTNQFTIHNAQLRLRFFTHGMNDGKARGVPLFGRDCFVALRAPRNRVVAKRGIKHVFQS